MALSKRKYNYTDFTVEPGTPVLATTTNAIATAADNQVDYTRVNGNFFDWIQTGASTALMPVVRTAAPFGWALPNDAAASEGIEFGEGALVSGNAPYKSFTVGTDPAFFIRARLSFLSNVDNVVVAAVGFRKSASQVDITSQATLGSVYADSAFIGVTTNAGAIKTSTSLASTVTLTSLAHAAASVAGTATTGLDFKLLVSATGVVTYTIDGAADASAVAFTFANGTVLVPAIATVGANGTGSVASPIVLQEYECGFQ